MVWRLLTRTYLFQSAAPAMSIIQAVATSLHSRVARTFFSQVVVPSYSGGRICSIKLVAVSLLTQS